MKKSGLFIFLLCAFVLIDQSAMAYCAVFRDDDPVNSSGEPTEHSNFRTAALQINNSNDSKNDCDVPSNHADLNAGFDDVIWFGTEFVVANDDEAISKITLSDANLTLTPYSNVKIGNSSMSMLRDEQGEFPNSSYSKSDYEEFYTTVKPKISLPETDSMIINGRAANLKCPGIENGDGELKGYIYLSDVVVLAAAGELMNEGCWRNAGHAFLCDGTLKNEGEDLSEYSDPHGKDYTKWCDSDTVTEQDGGLTLPWANAECAERETRWRDGDGDGFGDPDEDVSVCVKWVDKDTGEEIDSPFLRFSFQRLGLSIFSGFVSNVDNNLDCDDGAVEINPDAIELCDGIDNNCSGDEDELYTDLGTSCSDGVGACLAVGTWQCSGDGASVECDATAGSATTETCNDLDDDCDGSSDEDDVCAAPTSETLCSDIDSDGVPVDNDGDGAANCDDTDCSSTIACDPGEPTDDCSLDDDGATNCYDPNCWSNLDCVLVVPIDQDGDGVSIENGDCNDEPTDDSAKLILPSADEICDSVDNNCNDEIDESDVCVNPNESDDSGSNGSCACYLGNQKPNEFQKVFSAMLALGIYCALILMRVAKRATAARE